MLWSSSLFYISYKFPYFSGCNEKYHILHKLIYTISIIIIIYYYYYYYYLLLLLFLLLLVLNIFVQLHWFGYISVIIYLISNQYIKIICMWNNPQFMFPLPWLKIIRPFRQSIFVIAWITFTLIIFYLFIHFITIACFIFWHRPFFCSIQVT